jgi:hypothetical protein
MINNSEGLYYQNPQTIEAFNNSQMLQIIHNCLLKTNQSLLLTQYGGCREDT